MDQITGRVTIWAATVRIMGALLTKQTAWDGTIMVRIVREEMDTIIFNMHRICITIDLTAIQSQTIPNLIILIRDLLLPRLTTTRTDIICLKLEKFY